MLRTDRGDTGEPTMTTFTISNDSTDFGTFEGETPAHALAAMHRDAGYASKVVDGVVVPPASAVDADGVSLCPGIDDVTIAEVAPVLVSLDNGNSTTAIDTAEAAADFVVRFGEPAIVDHLAAKGLPSEDYDDALAVLRAFAGSLPAGEIPTLA